MQIFDVLWLAAGITAGFLIAYTVFKLQAARNISEQTALHSQRETENRLLKEQLEELKSTEALLRMELNEVSLSNT
ncbi:MAG: hypothetical protein K0Q50_3155, partial [Vampirovibrio sp.]|nr:hypothetical protein [Vampirovibrio sp.]